MTITLILPDRVKGKSPEGLQSTIFHARDSKGTKPTLSFGDVYSFYRTTLVCIWVHKLFLDSSKFGFGGIPYNSINSWGIFTFVCGNGSHSQSTCCPRFDQVILLYHNLAFIFVAISHSNQNLRVADIFFNRSPVNVMPSKLVSVNTCCHVFVQILADRDEIW